MPSPLSTYGFLSAKLKTRISKTLPVDTIDRLIAAKSLPEAVQVLKGTEYAAIEEAYSTTGDLRAGEAILYAREVELYTGLYRYVSEPVLSFIRSLALRFEIEKVKDCVRLWFDAHVRGRGIEGKAAYIYRATIVHPFEIDDVLGAADADALAQAFGDTPYAAIVRKEAPQVIADSSVFAFELALDRFYYEEAFLGASTLSRGDREVAERVLGVDVDMQNVSWLVRFKGAYGMSLERATGLLIPRGRAISTAAIAASYDDEKSGLGSGGALGLDLLRKTYGSVGALLGGGDAAARLSMMEVALRSVLASEANRSLAGYPFSIGIVLAYFTRKREEMRTVMTILNAKFYSLSEERIRSFL
ncbi:MAG: V-type ATPase subunit [Spirochaetia bacterium]|nr:V-type ATPase subunit [Spirochaetia bacterium]